MKLIGKVGTIAAAVLLAVAAGITPRVASASDGDTDFMVGAAHTCQMTPMQFFGGGGTYCVSFDVGVCVSTDQTPPEVFTCTRSESGSYSNTVCGTGAWFGTEITTEPDGASDSNGYSRTFVAGIGVESGGSTGVVMLVPTGTGAPSNCATSFELAGSAVTG